MTSFKAGQIAALAVSGWAQCRSVADAAARAGLPAVTAGYLRQAFTAQQWHASEVAVSALRESFSTARFADEVSYGMVLVPDPDRLDTRGPMDPTVRRDQLGSATADVVDPRLAAGRLGVHPGTAWTLVATVTGAYGPALGSYTEVAGADARLFTSERVDVRDLMVRQVWGARVLQSGSSLPDCEANDRWAFTLFPGEGLTDGLAESGTVLKGKVRFRLGKPSRGISSARVAPAIAVQQGIPAPAHAQAQAAERVQHAAARQAEQAALQRMHDVTRHGPSYSPDAGRDGPSRGRWPARLGSVVADGSG